MRDEDFLEEIVRERKATNPKFPELVEAALRRESPDGRRPSAIASRVVAVCGAVGATVGAVVFAWADWAAQGIFSDDHAPKPPLRRFSILRSGIEGAAAGIVVGCLVGLVVVMSVRALRSRRSNRDGDAHASG